MTDAWNHLLGRTPGEARRWRVWHGAALAAVAALVLGLFWHFGMHTATVLNDDPHEDKKNHDQTFYLEHAQSFINNPDTMFPRQHMPAYGLMLAPFMEKDEGIWDFFHRMKPLTVVYAVVALLLLAGALKLVFPWTETVLLASGCGLLLYVFRAGYYQPELMFYSLFFLSLLLLLRCLLKPSWGLAVVTGAVFALTHFFKSSLPAAILLLGAGVAVRMALAAVRKDWRAVAKEGAMGLVVPLTFAACLSPYLLNSWRVFGEPLYSAHTKYHMWVDTHEESRALAYMKLTRKPANLDQDSLERRAKNYEDFKHIYDRWREEGLPNPRRYFSEHTWSQIADQWQLTAYRTQKRIGRDYPWLVEFFQLLVAAAAASVVLNHRGAWRLVRTHWLAMGAWGLFIGGYLLAYIFYAKIGMGPRLHLGLAVPLVFGPAWLTWQLGRDIHATWGGRTVSFRKVVNWGLAAALVWLAHGALTESLPTVVGGQ